MDVYNDSLLLFWRTLNNNEVRYLIIGGLAVRFHGFKRGTKDVDIWIDFSDKNIANLNNVMESLGGVGLKDTEINPSAGWFQVVLSNGEVIKIFADLKGADIPFDESLNISPVAEIEGIPVPFLHINQLLANKKAVFRPKDQIDVIELEKIKEERRKMGLD